jgi:hypothetical protein
MSSTYGWSAGSIAELDVPQIVSGDTEAPAVFRVELHNRRRHAPHPRGVDIPAHETRERFNGQSKAP